MNPNLKTQEIAPGIIVHAHVNEELSGIYLDNERNVEMPEALRLDSGFYPKHLEWSRVVVAFPGFFQESMVSRAHRLLSRYQPHKYRHYLRHDNPMQV